MTRFYHVYAPFTDGEMLLYRYDSSATHRGPSQRRSTWALTAPPSSEAPGASATHSRWRTEGWLPLTLSLMALATRVGLEAAALFSPTP